jgi:hypothetical protein
MLVLSLPELHCVHVFQVPNSAPPLPPVRNTSIRTGASSACSEIESRFSEFFHSVHEFPTPQPFQKVCKIYNSKTGKLLLQLQSQPEYLFFCFCFVDSILCLPKYKMPITL